MNSLKRRTFFLGLGAVSAARTVLGQSTSLCGPDLIRTPDRVTVQFDEGTVDLERTGHRWNGHDVEVVCEPRNTSRSVELPVTIYAPQSSIRRLRLRWHGAFPERCRFLGDHWERSYGDLEWRGLVGERLMPWYFAASDGQSTHGYGVKTGASSIAYWQADAGGVTLWLDLQNGGSAVRLGKRQLVAANVVGYCGAPGESPMSAARKLCSAMCEHPRLPSSPVYGGNNWYYTYGKNLTSGAFLRDAELMAELSPGGDNRPFMVLDMGYALAGEGAGPVAKTSSAFADMPKLAADVKRSRVRPGIWVRPLLTVDSLPDTLRLEGNQAAGGVRPPFFVLDPSVPESLAYIEKSIRTARDWGFELIKHDYSTFDITGRWGFQMGPALTEPGWAFKDRTRTTAEIIRDLYRTIRDAAGDAQLIGCNTIGHLGAGLFEMQRIGDDTSGREWSRTRRMGVNTLAFRLPQHGTFFAADADCVPVTKDIPWRMTARWLDLVTRSATPLFVSADPATVGAKERSAIRAAFERAASPRAGFEPRDWMDTTTPSRWRGESGVADYKWYEDD